MINEGISITFMQITLDYTKTVAQNAAVYFDKAKKAKKKLEGVALAISTSEQKLKQLQENELKVASAPRVKRQKEWFERFHWFVTSSGFLAIGGRDASTNEIIIKKHMEPTDIVFHTEMAGSPFFLLKGKVGPEGKKPTQQDIEQVAQVTAVYAKGWSKGFSSVAVFYVKPEQVSKEANAGEFMAKGSFMIRGERTYLHPLMELYMGKNDKGVCVVGTKDNVTAQSTVAPVRIIQGGGKPSDVAKKIAGLLDLHELDEIIRMLPSSSVALVKGN